jgi:serine/threonine-protein kinase
MKDLVERIQDDLKDRYVVGPTLGRGTSATVFEAHDLRHRRSVAIKVLDQGAESASREESFRREIEIVAGLSHPHILPLHDSGVAGGLLYFVMPHIRGRTLREYLDQAGALPAPEALRIGTEIASALDYAHQRGIIHRDIKPGNILIESGHALVADFGLARFASKEPEWSSNAGPASSQVLAASGTIVGTPLYMSPEQATAAPVDGRSDLYALGCVLYEMITGSPPFLGQTVTEVLEAHQHSPPPGLSSVRPKVAEGVERALRRVLSKSPQDRPRDAAEFLAELRRLSAEHGRPGWLLPAIGLVTTAALGLLSGNHVWTPPRGPGELRRIAVLPFESRSRNPEDRYFAEGVSEEISRTLGGLPGVAVTARNSAASYTGSKRSARMIGRELGVDGLIKGSIETAGQTVRLTVWLLHAPSDSLLWSRRFERPHRNRHELPLEVARHLGKPLKTRLEPGARRSPGAGSAALEAYQRGRYHWNRRTAEDLHLALDDFRIATSLDSSFALAWVGLADTYGLLPQYEITDVDDVMQKARDAARRAIDLDSTLADAYASLGNIEKSWTFDWTAAESLYRKAIILDPNYATAHHWYAVLRIWRGDLQGGRAGIERASRLDPRSPVIRLTAARISYLQRNYPRAIREYQHTLELDDTRSSAWRGLSDAYFHQGRIREASSAWERSLGSAPESLGLRPGIPLGSRQAYLMRRLRSARRLQRAGLISPAELAATYANLDHKDEAFDLLERARMDELVYGDLVNLPDYDLIRSDPRFKVLSTEVRHRQP